MAAGDDLVVVPVPDPPEPALRVAVVPRTQADDDKLGNALHRLVEAHPAFATIHAPESNILCFRYVGGGTVTGAALDQLNFELRQRYNQAGEGWITTTVLGGQRVLRTTLMNPRTGPEHLERLLTGLATLGQALERGG